MALFYTVITRDSISLLEFLFLSYIQVLSCALSCLVLYAFCANLLHSLIMWLIVSSLLPHNLRGAFNKFPDIFVQAFKIVVDS